MSEYLWMVLALFCVFVCMGVLIVSRRKYVKFTERVSENLEKLINGEKIEEIEYEETLDAKIITQMQRLSNITGEMTESSRRQKEEVQMIVSDISHQLKTPIANLIMYGDTILDRKLTEEKQREFLLVMKGQLEKLDFLVKALMKMSRLENHLIHLHKEMGPLGDCVQAALEGVRQNAKQKEISLDVEIDENVMVFYDKKWLTEAIYNVLDNGVKYTPSKGRIKVCLEELELFSKVVIRDTGIGIETDQVNEIFKRFFREKRVSKEPGVGIGLYLTREIVSGHGGYIKVTSKVNEGSRFEIYLPRT